MQDLDDDEMDDEDKPVVPPREWTAAEVEQALAAHQLYLDTSGRQGRYVNLACAIISDFDFSGRDLHGMHFDHSTFSRCRFVGALLYTATFFHTKAEGCDMRDADFVKAELFDSDLRDVCLDGANLRRATLNGCDLRGASLRRADLTGAMVSECDLRGAVLDQSNLSDAFLRENQQ
jgi:uncharacterized protein YjbI with pentapeptide repeats